MKTEKITTAPETLPFCCSRQGVECGEKNVYTRLSLSLSLSPPLEKRAKGEVGGSWPLVRSNHPGFHSQSPGLPYWFDIYPSDAGWVVAGWWPHGIRRMQRAPSTPHHPRCPKAKGDFVCVFLALSAALRRSPAAAGPPGNAHAF